MKLSTKKSEQVEFTISNKTIIRILALVFASLLLIAAVRTASHALTMIFIAFFLALALNAPVHWIARHLPGKRRGNRTVATAVSFLLVVVIMGLFLASIVPPLVRQTTSFVESIPSLVDDLRDNTTTLGELVDRYNLEQQVDKVSGQVSSWATNATTGAIGTIGWLGGSFVSLLTVLVLTFMMLIEGPRWVRVARRLTPNEREAHIETLVRSMYRVIKGYVNGQVLLAAIAAVLILPILIIMDVHYPFALMVVVFFCGLIPMVGHTIGAVIVSVVALFTSPFAALIVLGYYILYQQIENYAVQPRIQSSTTDMSPLLVFASVVIGVSFNGLLGGLVAIPIAGCLRILILDYLIRNNMIEPSDAPEVEIVTIEDLPKEAKGLH